MIEALKKLFSEPQGDAQQSTDEKRKLAAAALLVEVARADFQQDGKEEEEIASLLADTLSVERAAIDELLADATDAVDSASSLYEFTRLINEHYSREEKIALVESMWRVAYADQKLHKYEEALIRRVATLIYVDHVDFIQSKLRSQSEDKPSS
jgi:uncharacterized tellurite resistance protein B-like protein